MRRAAINLILLLAKRRNVCPPSLMVQSNSRLVVNPWIWRGGGLADIHAGTYDGQHVVLKRVRIVGQADEQKAMHIVSPDDFLMNIQLTSHIDRTLEVRPSFGDNYIIPTSSSSSALIPMCGVKKRKSRCCRRGWLIHFMTLCVSSPVKISHRNHSKAH
jgi:hypothetical protein